MNFILFKEVEEILESGGIKEFPSCGLICTDCGQCVCCHKDAYHPMLDWDKSDILSDPDICSCEEVDRLGNWSHRVVEILKKAGYHSSGKQHAFIITELF